MAARRWAGAMLALVLALAGCGGRSPDGAEDTPSSRTAASPAETWDLVVLSDSSGWGLGDAWAELIRRDVGVEVNVLEMSTGLQSGTGLLEHLTTEGDPQREAVRQAEVISVWASPASLVWTSDANDCYVYPDGRRPPTHLSRRDYAPYAQLWRDILSEINFLRTGQPTALRARDVYNPALARYRAAGTAEGCARAAAMTTSTVREASRLAGATFVPVYRAFNGPDGMQDPRELGYFEDAEHLSDAGVALLAQLHHEAGYAELLDP